MHHLTKKSLVAKYAELKNSGVTKEEITDLLDSEDKIESKEDAAEILAELFADKAPDGKKQDSKATGTSNKRYECWKAKPVYKFSINEDTGEKEKTLTGIDKVGDKPTSINSMEEKHAEILNSQVDNSGVYYFTVN